jgi:MYND finger
LLTDSPSTTVTDDTVLISDGLKSPRSDGDDDSDCPLLACAVSSSNIGSAAAGLVSSNSLSQTSDATEHGDSVTVSNADTALLSQYAPSESSSTNSSYSEAAEGSSELVVAQQQQQQSKQSLQQQPCVQCGKLTKKRCRRCQAVYYCSEECQIQCFKDPEHRAQCEATAAPAAPTAAAPVAAALVT